MHNYLDCPLRSCVVSAMSIRDDEFNVTLASLELTDGLRTLRDRIEAVPKRVTLAGPPALAIEGEDFGAAARQLAPMYRSLDSLWPED